MSFEQEVNAGRQSRAHRWLSSLRRRMQHHPLLYFVYRLIVIGLGTIFLLLGIIMLITPGPGWLFIFLGLGLWGTEFTWAHRFNVWAKAKVLATWRSLEAKRQRKLKERQRRIWAGRENPNHYCPNGSHYH